MSAAFLRRYWPQTLAVLAFALLVIAATVQTFRLQSAVAELETERLGRASDRKDYQRAQAEATADALSAKMKKEAEYAAKADEADARYADLSGQYRAAVLRYQAAQRAVGGTDLPSAAEATQSRDGSGGGAVIPAGDILIPQADALICAENTARLEAVRAWALSIRER
ncbi:hypothetical protein SAMN05518668_104352 [Sphingobium sp. YR657]|uniref:hypothetical protein n=1 Tax=Sphingobium sp. YR657 TaxID=1884366 RepID=UPI00091652AE|nr:hypothetical protein [Sphingobium sp. YR657]SHL96482.1 hypothetical protein SAMN05518668_104352 [Sphingobium sp. YR657]